jgi:hypothetical protein
MKALIIAIFFGGFIGLSSAFFCAVIFGIAQLIMGFSNLVAGLLIGGPAILLGLIAGLYMYGEKSSDFEFEDENRRELQSLKERLEHTKDIDEGERLIDLIDRVEKRLNG